jgi:hypothetical protein
MPLTTPDCVFYHRVIQRQLSTPLTTPDCVLFRIKVVVSAVTFHPLNGFTIRITDTMDSHCTCAEYKKKKSGFFLYMTTTPVNKKVHLIDRERHPSFFQSHYFLI